MTEKEKESKIELTMDQIMITMTMEMTEKYEKGPIIDDGKIDAVVVASFQIEYSNYLLLNEKVQALPILRSQDAWRASLEEADRGNWETLRLMITSYAKKMMEDDTGEGLFQRIGKAYLNLADSI